MLFTAIREDEIPAEVWKLDDFKEFLLESCNRVYFQEPIVVGQMDLYFIFLKKKKTFPSQKNYKGITLTAIASKIIT